MDVATIDVPRFTARQAYQDYRKAMREGRANDEDETLLTAYRALSRGKMVLSIVDVMKGAGVDGLLRPRVAICRADAEECWFTPSSWNHSRRPVFSETSYPSESYVRKNVVLSQGTFPRVCNSPVGCIVPTIPPKLRPGDRTKYYILWEAAWELPPADPMLLRRLRGPFYAVVATWDLTKLEQAIIAAR